MVGGSNTECLRRECKVGGVVSSCWNRGTFVVLGSFCCQSSVDSELGEGVGLS